MQTLIRLSERLKKLLRLMNQIYLDYNATTPVSSEVMEAMHPYFSTNYGNPSSSHSAGQKALRAMDLARTQVASLLEAKVDEIIFTGSGTEANNIALIGIANKFKGKGNHIITSSAEHSSVYNTCKHLESCGFELTYLPVDSNGIVSCEDLKTSITDKTILISVILANNETGVIQNIKEFAAIAGEHRIVFHTDAVQAAGKIALDVSELGADMMSISAHKIYGPKGVGALFIRRGLSLSTLIHGGGQERKLRSGTENVPAIVGFGKACEVAKLNLTLNSARLSQIKNLLEKEILSRIKGSKINGVGAPRVSNTTNISFVGTESETLLVKLDLNGIFVSSGSACGAASLEPSRTLKAMGLTEVQQHSALRFSVGLQTTSQDIDFTVETLKKLSNQ